MAHKNEIKIGDFILGHLNVELFGMPDNAGSAVYFKRTPTARPRIEIGFKDGDQIRIISDLLHESMEFCMLLMDARYHPTGTQSSQDCIFHFTHAQYERLCENQAMFIHKAFPDTLAAFEKWKRAKK